MTRTRSLIRSSSPSTWLDTEDGVALVAQRGDQVEDGEALARVQALDRLVEDEQRRAVDDGLGDLGALPLAARALAQRPRVGGVEADPVHRLAGRADRVGQADEPGGGLDEAGRALVVEERLLLGREADAAVHLRVPARVVAEQPDRAPRGPGEAADQAEQGGLAGAVRPEQGGDAGAQREGDVGDGDDLAVPAADADQLGDGLGRRPTRGRAAVPGGVAVAVLGLIGTPSWWRRRRRRRRRAARPRPPRR